jgi:hypothetical protein
VKPEELLQLVHQKPFQPFRIHLRDGRTFDVRYPHLAVVGAGFFDLGIPVPGDPDPFICDHVEHLQVSEIARTEMIEQRRVRKNGSTPVTAEELFRLVHHEPFQPFRIYLQDGRSFDVRYPHLAAPGVEYFDLGIPVPGDPDPFYCDHVEYLYVPHITDVELIDRQASEKN